MYRINSDSDNIIDTVLRSNSEMLVQLVDQYKQGKGSLACNFIDAGIKLRPNEEEVRLMGSEFEKMWKAYFLDKPDKPLVQASMFST